MDTSTLIEKFNLFWQYPVITEKKFSLERQSDPYYLGFPWATVIDKNINLQIIQLMLQPLCQQAGSGGGSGGGSGAGIYTCCQHIYFRRLIPLWKMLGVRLVFTPHKTSTSDGVEGDLRSDDIVFKACPLYAVNLEDNSKNGIFKMIDLEKCPRPIWYSFCGAYQANYLSDVRMRLFNMTHRKDCIVKNTGQWHFNEVVYDPRLQNREGDIEVNDNHKKKTGFYNSLLVKSRFTLAPVGSGPNTIRFWEGLGAGSIPVILSDTMELPPIPDGLLEERGEGEGGGEGGGEEGGGGGEGKKDGWDTAIIRVQEQDVGQIPEILSAISREKEEKMRKKCLLLYNYFKDHFYQD